MNTNLSLQRRAAALLATLALTGCTARPTDTSPAIEQLRTDAVPDPCHVVFTCHGIVWDLGARWDVKMRDEVLERGGVGLGVTYFSGPTGVWFGYGDDAPGDRIAEMADAITDLHASSGCTRPLILDAVGFSLGGEALLHAARSCRNANFRRLVLVHSSTAAFTGAARDVLATGRVGDIVSYWSPFDFATLFAPLGAGQFGLRFCGPRVENVCELHPHGPLLLHAGRRRRILDRLFDVERAGTDGGGVDRFAAALADYLEGFAQPANPAASPSERDER